VRKVVILVPAYTSVPSSWWLPLMAQISQFHKQDIDLVDIKSVSGMMADVARNGLAREGLATDADYFYWCDADNVHGNGALERLLNTAKDKTIVTGIYVKRTGDPTPIAYLKTGDGRFTNLSGYRPGEIIPVDSAGLGGCIIHRSVFEDFDMAYRVLQAEGDKKIVVHKDDIQGDVFDGTSTSNDGKVVDGVYHQRLHLPKGKVDVPFFMLEGGRTEDHFFFERATRLGHKLWCDTGVELGHITETVRMPAEFQKWSRDENTGNR
jgi:hypothetical protein